MKRHGKGIALVGVVLLAVTGSIFWVAESGAVTQSRGTVVPPGLQPRGTDVVIHTDSDINFCLEDVPGSVDQSPISISQCAVRSTQDWMFAQVPNGSVGIIDGGGDCLQNVGGGSLAIAVDTCTLGGNQQFFYTESGQISTTNGKFCLQYNAAQQNAGVRMDKCTAGLNTQVWKLSL